ncbi:MAG: PAS domain-containing protein [Pseudomonadales bacterium]
MIIISAIVAVLCAIICYTSLSEKKATWRPAGMAVASVFGLLGIMMVARIPIVISRFSEYSFLNAPEVAPLFVALIFFVVSITLTLIMLSYASLQSEYRLFMRVVFQSSSSIMITDVEGNVRYVNPAFRKRTGFNMFDLMNQDKIKRFGEFTTEALDDSWKTIKQGQTWRGELKNQAKNGDAYWEMATISPVRFRGKIVTHYVVIKEDISALKDAEEKSFIWQIMMP